MSDIICRKIVPGEGLLHGALVGNDTSEYEISEFERMSGTELDITLKFLSFGYGLFFPSADARAASKFELSPSPKSADTANNKPINRKGALFIKLEPWSGSGKGSVFSLGDITDGKHDYLLIRFAEGAQRFGKPIFVSFAHEMNGNWYPWSGKPELYIKAYRHVHDVISKYACNITWVWNPDVFGSDLSKWPALQYYPGPEYVDVIAIDGYNKSGAQTAASIFSNSLKKLKPKGKPMIIGEFGCGGRNRGCFADAVNFFADPKNEIRGFIYFKRDDNAAYEIRTPDQQLAYYNALRKLENLFKSQIMLGPPAIAPEKPEVLLSGRILPFGMHDSELGKADAYSRPLLNRLKVESKIPLEQLEKVLEAIAFAPPSRTLDPEEHLLSAAEFNRTYADLARIKETDKINKYKLYPYLRDFRTYWDNTIVLLSVYVQKITEDTRLDKKAAFPRALEISDRIMERVKIQLAADEATGRMRGPSFYSQRSLDLIRAEIYSQIDIGENEFYQDGLELAVFAMKGLIDGDPKGFESRPDYYSILKGSIILGDLYGRLATFEHNPTYYDMAEYLYESVLSLDQGKSEDILSIDLLSVDPISDLDLFFEVSPKKMDEALDFNVGENYITPDDKRLAQNGIYHQLRGMALIKRAELFTSRPGLKKIEDAGLYFAHTAYGMTELRYANQQANLPDKKNQYFYNQAKVLQGSLLMLLADRVKFYYGEAGTRFTSTFTKEEFEHGGTVKGLLRAIGTDDYKITFKAPENTLERLNEILETPQFFDLWEEKYGNKINLSSEVNRLVGITADYRDREFKKLSDSRQKVIKRMNRLLLKLTYPDVCPSAPTHPNAPELKGFYEAIDAAKNFFPEEERFGIIEEELPILEADQIVAIARDYYFKNIPDKYKYIYAQSWIKSLEIAIRNADFEYNIDEETWGFADFNNEEFKGIFTIKDLSRAIDSDAYGITSTKPENTVERLNELLETPAFYDIWRKKHAEIKLRPEGTMTMELEGKIREANRLIKATRFYRDKPFAKLFYSEKEKIKRLNRFILEITYPQKCPWRKHSKTSDAEASLNSCDEIHDLIAEISEGKKVPEFLETSFDYLRIILLITGVGHKNKEGKYIPSSEGSVVDALRTIYPMEALRLISGIEEKIFQLVPISRVYFEINAELKEAAAVIQIAQGKGKYFEEMRTSAELNDRIRRKMGAEYAGWVKKAKKLGLKPNERLADYCLWLMKRVEKRLAPILPEYLWYNVETTMRRRIEKLEFQYVTGKIMLPFKDFIDTNVKDFYPEAYERVKGKYDALFTQLTSPLKAGKKEECIKAQDALLTELKTLNRAAEEFKREFAEINAWDLNIVFAELYHNLSIIYSVVRMDRKQKGRIMYQYTQSAYMKSEISTSPYDQQYRWYHILMGAPEQPQDWEIINEWRKEQWLTR